MVWVGRTTAHFETNILFTCDGVGSLIQTLAAATPYSMNAHARFPEYEFFCRNQRNLKISTWPRHVDAKTQKISKLHPFPTQI